MAQATEQFEIDGVRFWFKRVSLEDGCLSVRMLWEAMGGAAGRTVQDYVAALSKSIDTLPKLVHLFAGYCEVQGDSGLAGGRKVKLTPFVQDCFAGNLDRALLFVAHCSAIEHGDFLGERLLKLGRGLGELAERYPALLALIPSSGDSSSASTSKTD